MPEIAELQERKNELAEEIRKLADRQDEWTAEDKESWDKRNEEYDAARTEVEAAQERQSIADRAAEIAEEQARSVNHRIPGTDDQSGRQEAPGIETRALALQGWCMAGKRSRGFGERHKDAMRSVGLFMEDDEINIPRAYPSAPGGYGMWSRNNGGAMLESRDLAVSSEPEVIPEGFVNMLDKAMLAYGGPRQVCRILRTATGNDLPIPTADDTGNTGELLAEAASIGSSVDPTISAVTLQAYKYSSKLILVSYELLADEAVNLASEIGAMAGERLGRIQATHYTTGTGSSQPNGIVTASGLGVTAASATAVTADELIDLFHALDPSYRALPSAGWMFNDTSAKNVRKLKDGDNQYLWQPGLQAGQPDVLLGKPVTINQDMPAMTTGLKSFVFGAMEKYVIRDAGPVRFKRLDERYADTDQVAFIAFSRHDGDATQSGAFKHLIQA